MIVAARIERMTFINRLIKEAKSEPPPRELTIRPNQVRAMAEHCQSCTSHFLNAPKIEEIEEWIRAGALRLLGVPVRVLGQP